MKKLFKSTVFFSTLALSPGAFAQADGRGVGAGIGFAAPTQATVVNPAVLTEAKLAAEGLWRFSTNTPFVSAVNSVGNVGFGGAYRKEGNDHLIEGAVAGKIGMVSLGVTGRVQDGDFDADTGANLDLQVIRLSAVARGWNGGLDRLDFGVGVMAGPAAFAVDFKKTFPLNDDQKAFYMDFSATVDVGLAAIGVGYDVAHTRSGGWSEGSLHAGLSAQVFPMLYVQGYYRPLAQEWNTGKWALGARYTF